MARGGGHAHTRTHSNEAPAHAPGGTVHTGTPGSCRASCRFSHDRQDVQSTAQLTHSLLWNVPGRRPREDHLGALAGGRAIRCVSHVCQPEEEREPRTQGQGRKDSAQGPISRSASGRREWGHQADCSLHTGTASMLCALVRLQGLGGYKPRGKARFPGWVGGLQGRRERVAGLGPRSPRQPRLPAPADRPAQWLPGAALPGHLPQRRSRLCLT